MSAAISVGTGIAIAGGVGAVGAIAAGSMAADATKSATNAAIGEEQSALATQGALSAPYRGVGTAAIPEYEALLGITPPATGAPGAGGRAPQTITLPGGRTITLPGSPATGAPTAAPTSPTIMQALESTPGYQFARSQGDLDIENQASLAGGVSGNTLAALDQFNTGLASETYQQSVDNIARAVGTGQAAAAGQAQNVGNAASDISGLITNQGNLTAGIDANTIAGLTKAVGGAADTAITMEALKALNNQTSPS